MKINALPAGAGGNPGTDLGSIHVGRTASNEKLAAAKAIAEGKSPMKLAESDTPVDPQVRRAQESIRKIKMRTNASTNRDDEAVLAAQSQAAPTSAIEATDPKSAILDSSGTTNAVTEATQPLSPQLASIAKQRRALQVKERELADREKAIQAQPQSNANSDLAARLKSEPLSVLQEHGVTYDQLTDAIIANSSGINPEIQKLRQEIKALQEGVDKRLTEKDQNAEQAVLAEMRREAETLSKTGDAFEMVRETKSINDVMDLIHRTYKATGEVLEVSQALELVENELINESIKIANIKKVQSKLKPAQSAPAPQQSQNDRQMKTLTNRDGAAPTLDRRARALAAFHGKQ